MVRENKRTRSSLSGVTGRTKPDTLGFGLGLRPQQYPELIEGNRDVEWIELISENFMVPGGAPLAMLDRVRACYPVVMHGVSLSIASTAEINLDYLKKLKSLAARVEPRWISDHLCWTGVHGVNVHDLLPIPYTEEALDHVVSRVHFVQDFLTSPIALENVSTYVQFRDSQMSGWEFLTELSRRTSCWVLLDITNVFVSAFNHGYDPRTFLTGIPTDRVIQLHLAGFADMETHMIDTHDQAVSDEVWDLYRLALQRFGPVSTMIERDENIPPLAELVEELARARAIANEIFSSQVASVP
jgi:uncharacterized protein (UPF0276 family)